MLVTCLVGLASVASFAAVGPRLARLLPPRTAAILLVCGALLTTGALLAVVVVLAVTAVAWLPALARAGDWSPAALRAGAPVPAWVAVGCAVLLVPFGVRAGAATLARWRAIVGMRRACRGLGSGSPVVVLDSDQPQAFATPVHGGQVVVTTGMLRALRRDEVRALFAHEAAHLRHRHAWWVLVAQLSAAVNPTLWPVVRAAEHVMERWADEDAAVEVGDRRLVARAVARAALQVRHATDVPGAAVGGGDVPARVRALLAGPPRRHVPATVVLAGLTALSLAWAATVQDRADDFFDAAHLRGAVSTSG